MVSLIELRTGDVRRGVVVRFESFGVMIDVGGVEGLVDASNLSWLTSRNPSETLREGQEIAVLVVGIDLEREELSLSIKDLLPDPLQEFARLNLGCIVQGKVAAISPIGSFVRVGNGIEGLIRDSTSFREGEEVQVVVESVNLYRRQVALVICPLPEEG